LISELTHSHSPGLRVISRRGSWKWRTWKWRTKMEQICWRRTFLTCWADFTRNSRQLVGRREGRDIQQNMRELCASSRLQQLTGALLRRLHRFDLTWRHLVQLTSRTANSQLIETLEFGHYGNDIWPAGRPFMVCDNNTIDCTTQGAW